MLKLLLIPFFLFGCVSQNVSSEKSRLEKESKIKDQLNELMPKLSECTSSMEIGSSVTSDIVFLDFWIEPSGRVEQAFVQGLDSAPDIHECITKRVKDHQFKAPDSNSAFWMRNPLNLNQPVLFDLGK